MPAVPAEGEVVTNLITEPGIESNETIFSVFEYTPSSIIVGGIHSMVLDAGVQVILEPVFGCDTN